MDELKTINIPGMVWRLSHGGSQGLKFFDNGQGVSVVQHHFSYGNEEGLWELAVMKGDEEHCELDYTTTITHDVLGYLSEEAVREAVKKIEALPCVPLLEKTT